MEKLYLIIFLAGLVIGKILNMYIERLCPGGGYEGCNKKASVLHLLVELINGLIYVWVTVVRGLTFESFLFCGCASVLLAVGIIDEKTFEIPLECNMLIGILGGIHLFLDFAGWQDYLIGMCAVSGLFLITYFLTKKKGIGGGDIKLMAAAGLLLGWQKILLALFIGSVAGMIIHLLLMKIKGKSKVLAFGPYLAFGIFAAMLYGEAILTWYLNFYI